MTPDIKIIESFFNSTNLGSYGIVLTHDKYEGYACFQSGFTPSGNRTHDEHEIASWGNKAPREVMLAYFPYVARLEAEDSAKNSNR